MSLATKVGKASDFGRKIRFIPSIPVLILVYLNSYLISTQVITTLETKVSSVLSRFGRCLRLGLGDQPDNLSGYARR